MRCEENPCVVCKVCFLLSSKNHILFSNSRCKLRVLNLIDKTLGFLSLEDNESEESEFLSEFLHMPIEKGPYCLVKNKLKVICELHLMEGRVDESATHLFQWAQQQKDSIHLCCRMMMIHGLTRPPFKEIFTSVYAGCIQTLFLSNTCIIELFILTFFLRATNSLSTLILHHITGALTTRNAEKLDEKIFRFISQQPTLHFLQILYVHDVSFIKGNLNEYLR